MAKYEAVIGLEVHVQIRTASKMFCSCPNKFGAEPNTMVCPVCMGYPGTMPVPNHEAIRKTVAAGLMTSCKIAEYSKFDRKNYFYPDMPKSYQISQYDLPFCSAGRVHIGGKGFSGAPLPEKFIGITRIHLEEDVGKSNHLGHKSGIDYNRAGVPLMEIVSEPDMRSADEAHAYLTALKQAIQYAEIGDCDMEKGQMRCDVNISVRPEGTEKFGTKVEIKNLNSFRSVHRSIIYEIKRQSKMVDAGEKINQETRGWNDNDGETYLLRSKECAHDYRYFPEPDLMPVRFTQDDIEQIRKSIPEHPEAIRARFVESYGLTPYDAQVLTLEKEMSEYFEAAASKSETPKTVANWICSELMRELSDAAISIKDCKIKPEQLAALVKLINDGTINGKIAKEVFADMFKDGGNPADIVKAKGLVQVTDESAVVGFVQQVIDSNPDQVKQYLDGKKTVIQFLVGQVMKISRGKANPPLAIKILKEKLGE